MSIPVRIEGFEATDKSVNTAIFLINKGGNIKWLKLVGLDWATWEIQCAGI